jgi:hypothetical protein
MRTVARAGRGYGGRVSGALHEWVSMPDPDEDRTWLFDVTFLESNWTCIYGQGCQGVLTGPAPELQEGCCSYGAHLTGKEDARRVEEAAATLTPDQWQFWREGQPRPSDDKAPPARPRSGRSPVSTKAGRVRVVKRLASGDLSTRLVDDACIFLNRADFPGGAGCALHRAALERGEAPLDLKPDVCWQLPLRREDQVGDDGHVTSVIEQWDRRHWGDGGAEFHWWCTDAPDAFVGRKPVYEELGAELRAMVGKAVYRQLLGYFTTRAQSTRETGRSVPLPHPALRQRT